MKKIATIFLFLFIIIQAYPAINFLFEKTSTFFVIDNEKNGEKIDSNKKDKKDIIACLNLNGEFSHSINIAFHLSEKIYSSPCLEQHTPPPNLS